MNAVRIVYLAASILWGILIAGLLRPARGRALDSRGPLGLALATVIVALLLVGVVSHTFVRHVVQIIPPAAALLLVARGSEHGPAAAAPIFTFWLGIMVAIWLFLLGIARMFTGTFSVAEIVLTIAIAIACAFGLVAIARSGSRASLGKRLATATAFAIAQFAAMIASFQPIFR